LVSCSICLFNDSICDFYSFTITLLLAKSFLLPLWNSFLILLTYTSLARIALFILSYKRFFSCWLCLSLSCIYMSFSFMIACIYVTVLIKSWFFVSRARQLDSASTLAFSSVYNFFFMLDISMPIVFAYLR
jgi:hypothetical protein